MTVFINGRFLSQSLTGVQRVAYQLTDRLVQRLDDVAVLAPSDIRTRPEAWPIRITGRLRGQAWEQGCLPMAARSGLLLSLSNLGPVLHPRQVVMIHDAATFDTPENYGFAMRTAYRVLLPALGKRTKRVLTVSEFSKARLAHHGIAPAQGISVVHNGVDHVLDIEPDEQAASRFGLTKGGYVLAVGSTSRNKNLSLVVDALKRLGPKAPPLALVGSGGGGVFARAQGLEADRVRALGYLDDATLHGLYRDALCLAFPSRYEGFGLPPLEAMSLGCPAIVSTSASLPEVCGDAALFCDPDDAETMANHIRSLSDNPELRKQLIAAGHAQAARFTWDKAAADVEAVLREIEAATDIAASVQNSETD